MQLPFRHLPLFLPALLTLGCEDGAGPGSEPCEVTVDAAGVREAPAAIFGDGVCLEALEDTDVFVVVSAALDADAAIEVDVLGSGFLPGGPTPLEQRAGAASGPAPEARLRRWEAEVLGPRLASREVGSTAPLSGPPDPAAVVLPEEGSLLTLDASIDCEASPDPRSARVVRVGLHSVVVQEVGLGGGGYDDVELHAFGMFFDEVVHPVLTESFGDPSDIDGNGRTILFFTASSNGLNGPQAAGVVGGFFWAGDLLPPVASEGSGLAPCPTSDGAEIIHLSVPDPDGLFGPPVSSASLYAEATIGHEFQHLVNAGRRIHVAPVAVVEDTWVNEGLSYIAEERLFQATSGGDRDETRVGPSELQESGRVDAFNAFVFNSVGRYNVFVQAPHLFSPSGDDGVETRGAAWALLRYLIDRTQDPEAEVLRRIVDSGTRGLASLEAGFGPGVRDTSLDWGATLVGDALGGQGAPTVDARFQQRSWNLPALIRAFRADRRYRVGAVPVQPDVGLRYTLAPGGAGVAAVRVPAGGRSVLRLRVGTPATSLRAVLLGR